MEYIKKYWYIPIIILLTGTAVWFLKPDKVIMPLPDQVMVHKFDSVKYIKRSDSLVQVIDTLKSKLEIKKRQYADLLNKQRLQIVEVQTMPATEVVQVFRDKVQAIVTLTTDSNVITPIQGIRNAVIMFVQGDQCLDREKAVLDQQSISGRIIQSQDTLLQIKDKRIIGLTREFYTSQVIITGLNTDLEKERKKVRTRNIILGVLSGVAAAGIVVAVIK